MITKEESLRTFGIFVILAILFNLFLLVKLSLIDTFDLQISQWLYAQYLFTYTDEFVKRGAIGTLFHLSGVRPNDVSIFLTSLFFSNFFFVLFFFFSRKQMSFLPERAKISFMVLFIVSPAIAMHLGFDAGRFDHITLALTIACLIMLVRQASGFTYVIVPLLLALGLLIHEAFLFINAPVILAVSIHEIRKKNYSTGLLLAEVITVMVTLICLMVWGKASPETLERVSADVAALAPDYDLNSALRVWTNSVKDNVSAGLSRYSNKRILLQMLFVLPFLAVNFLLYKRLLNPSVLSLKLVFYSPFSILPLFVLGVDYFRWMALFIVMMFIAFAYLAKESREGLLKPLSIKDKMLLILMACYTLIGPLGISMKSFPVLLAHFSFWNAK